MKKAFSSKNRPTQDQVGLLRTKEAYSWYNRPTEDKIGVLMQGKKGLLVIKKKPTQAT
jgi:hypothetical protein